MKYMKLMVAMVMMAAFTQAAAIQWGVGNYGITAYGSSSGAPTGTQVYLIDAAMQATIVAAIEDGIFNYVEGAAEGTTGGVIDMRTTTGNKGYIANVERESAYLTPDVEYNLAILVFDSNENPEFYYISDFKHGYAYTPGVGEPDPINFTGGDWSSSGSSGEYQQVPEPTSVALLLMGVAAIGLRRRFRG